jgi:5'-nucleotidase
MRERIAIDMDETICDTLSRHLDWYNTEFNQQLSKADLAGYKIYDKVLPDAVAQVRAYPDNPDFFVDIPIYPQARAVIEELHQHFEIVIATAAMEHPNSFAPKYQWLVKHLPFLSPMNFVFCGNKGLVKADYLIDDSARHFDGFVGQGVLFSAPHNLYEPSVVRVENWQDVSDYFLKI